MGSYESQFLDDSFFEWAMVLKRQGKYAVAQVALEELLAALPFSRYRDDAAYELALLLSGPDRVRALEVFVRDYPDSRYGVAARRGAGL